jgi:hypothetical protein
MGVVEARRLAAKVLHATTLNELGL